MNKFCILENIGLNNRYENVLDFPIPDDSTLTSEQLRDNFWDTKVLKTYLLGSSQGNYKFINSNKVIVYEDYETSRSYSYCYFETDIGIHTKRVYCFINEVRALTSTTTELTIERDVYTNNIINSNFSLRESFVEREHQDRWLWDFSTSRLKPIFSRTNEQLNYGENYKTLSLSLTSYAKNESPTRGYNLNWLYIYAKEPISNEGDNYTTVEGGTGPFRAIDTGLYIYCIPYTENFYDGYNNIYHKYGEYNYRFATAEHFIRYFRESSKVLAIEYSKIPPANYTVNDINTNEYSLDFDNNELIDFHRTFTWTLGADTYTENIMFIKAKKTPLSTKCDNNLNTLSYFYKINRPNKNINASIDNETKLLTYPYNFQKILFGEGELDLKNEYLKEDTTIYSVKGIGVEGTNAIYIKNVKTEDNTGNNVVDNNMIITQQQPYFLTLRTDAWEQYITANRSQRITSYATAGANALLGMAGGAAAALVNPIAGGAGVIGSAVSGIEKIFQLNAQEKDLKATPDDIRQFNGDLSLANLAKYGFGKLIRYDIEQEYKQKIFKYLQHYGYKANEFKIPDLQSRYYYNYIKITNPNFKSNCGTEENDTISRIFENGTTIWHYRDASTFKGIMNYDYENVEINLDF